MPQLHPKFISEGLLFPLHIVVAAVRTDTLYSASKPHQIFLPASEWTEASPSRFFSHRAGSSPLRPSPASASEAGEPIMDCGRQADDPVRPACVVTTMNPTTFPSCSDEASARLWQ